MTGKQKGIRPDGWRLVVFAIIFVVCIGAATRAAVSMASDLIAKWPGDGNSTEIVAGRNGVEAGAVGYAQGMVGDGFNFGQNTHVEVADDPVWTLGANDFTIDLWAKFDSVQPRSTFIAHDTGGGEQNKWIFWYDAYGHDKQNGVPALRFHINSPHPGAVPNAHDAIVAPWNPQTGHWYHIAITRQGSNYALYIDGVQVATDTDSYSIPDPSAPLTLGFAEGANQLLGGLDEVEIHGRALSASEIQAIYNSAFDTSPPTSTHVLSPAPSITGWNNGSVDVAITAADNTGGSGVKEIHTTIDLGTETISAGSSATATVSTEGVHSVAYWAVDNAGNIESTRYATVWIDTTSPATTATVSAGQVFLSASDSASGVSKTYYRLNGGTAVEYVAPFPANVSRISYWSVDTAGNTEIENGMVLNPAVTSVSTPFASVVGGVGILGEVTLDTVAPVGGTVVYLASDNVAASVPASVTVAEGTRSATFAIATSPVVSDQPVFISASAFGTNAGTLLVVVAPQPKAVAFAPASVIGGSGSTGTVTLTGPAPSGGWVVALSSNLTSVNVPASVTVPAGQISTTFTAATSVVTATTVATVTATANGAFVQGTLTVNPAPPICPALRSLALAPATVKGGIATTGTVSLTAPAGPGGVIVALSSSKTTVATVPISVTVPAGASSASFNITTKVQRMSASTTISAKLGTVTKTAVLTVTK